MKAIIRIAVSNPHRPKPVRSDAFFLGADLQRGHMPEKDITKTILTCSN